MIKFGVHGFRDKVGLVSFPQGNNDFSKMTKPLRCQDHHLEIKVRPHDMLIKERLKTKINGNNYRPLKPNVISA